MFLLVGIENIKLFAEKCENSVLVFDNRLFLWYHPYVMVKLTKTNASGEVTESKVIVLRTDSEIAKDSERNERITLWELVTAYFSELNGSVTI
jgi:hypothetical protein